MKWFWLLFGAALLGVACGGETVGDTFEPAGGGSSSGGASGKGSSGSGGSPGAGGGVTAGGAGVAGSAAVAGVAGVPFGGAGGGAAVAGVGPGGFGAGGGGGSVSGGAGGVSGDECTRVLKEYESLAAQARQCSPFVDAIKCQFVAAGMCCPISVNDPASVERLGTLIDYARKVCVDYGCVDLLCPGAPSFNCVPLSGVAPGMCM